MRVVSADYPGCPVTVDTAIRDGRELRDPQWGIWDAVITIVGSIVTAVVAVVILTVLDTPLIVAAIVGTAAPWIFMAGWPLFITKVRGNGPRIDLGLRMSWSDVGWGVIAGFGALFAAGVVAALSTLVFGDFNSAAGEIAEELQASGSWIAIALFALLIVVGAPIVEEIAFRGLFFASLMKRGVPPIATVLITAVVFSLFHFEPIRIGILLVTGVILGIVRWRTRSLGSAIIAHAVNNAPGAVFLLVAS